MSREQLHIYRLGAAQKRKGPVALSQFSATLQYTCAFKFWVRNKMINLNNLQI